MKNKAEKLLKTKDWASKTNRNKPENKAEKLLKTRACGKNKPENKPTDIAENKEWRKTRSGVVSSFARRLKHSSRHGYIARVHSRILQPQMGRPDL